MSIVCLEWQLDVIREWKVCKEEEIYAHILGGLTYFSWSFAARDLQVATTSSNLSINAMSNSRHYV
jgi:hypothetical protein